ncbi:MAG: trypsin-like peptidase domain-containing protein [Candidatus Paceibacterota bacterium]|jgi:serine protease Do
MSIYELPKFNFFKKEKDAKEKSGQPAVTNQPIEPGVLSIDINTPSGSSSESSVKFLPLEGEPIMMPPATTSPVCELGKDPIQEPKPKKGKYFSLSLILILALLVGLIGGGFSGYYFYSKIRQDLGMSASGGFDLFKQGTTTEKIIEKQIFQDTREEKIINTVKEVSPSVVSIAIYKNMPVYQYQSQNSFQDFFGNPIGGFIVPQIKGYEKQEVGAGSGFIVSEDGLVLTNKHVVEDTTAEYKVITNDGKEYTAKILARDPAQDLAILKIEGSGFLPLKLGESNDLQIGQTVIAIGNALGEFQNTVSTGVVSGLSRSITASGGQMKETLENVIQTDAAINSGNSGGPLLNLSGEVIGINTAVASQAQGIGFALPIDLAKRDIEQVKKNSKISYPFLGVKYTLITPEIAKQQNISVDYGALISKGSDGSVAVVAGSPAAKAGLKEKDIILEFNGEKITQENTLTKAIADHLPGDKVTLKIARNNKQFLVDVTLGEWSQ